MAAYRRRTSGGRMTQSGRQRPATRIDLHGLGNVEQRPRTLGGHEQQGACRTRRRTPSLFPVLQRSHRYSKQRRKPRLGKSSLSSDHRDIWHVDHATVLAALDLAQPIQDLTAHILFALAIFHFIPDLAAPRCRPAKLADTARARDYRSSLRIRHQRCLQC